MSPLPDAYDYAEVGADAPEPDDGTCAWCGEFPCRDDCGPPSVRGEEPDYPQGGEHYIEVEMREERENG